MRASDVLLAEPDAEDEMVGVLGLVAIVERDRRRRLRSRRREQISEPSARNWGTITVAGNGSNALIASS